MPRKQNTLLLFILTSCMRLPGLEAQDCSLTIQVDPTLTNTSGCSVSQLVERKECLYMAMEPALDLLTSDALSSYERICLNLSAGIHTLSYSERVMENDFTLTGSGSQNTVVMCVNEDELSQDNYVHFPLHFANRTVIEINGVSFKGCARPLLFSETSRVALDDCSFSSFTESAVEIYNTPFITISNCSFTNNTSNGISPTRNSGNAGALSIGFNETFMADTTSQITIEETDFVNNSANSSTECDAVNAVLHSKNYIQRGGGVAFYIAAGGLSATITIKKCQIVNNTAENSGGGVYINLSGTARASSNISFEDCNFTENHAVDGGGMQLTLDTSDSVLYPNFISLQNCNFENNSADLGAALKVVQFNTLGNLNIVNFKDCSFVGNTGLVGAGLHLQSLFVDTITLVDNRRITIDDCTFMRNTGQRSVVFITHNHVNFLERNTFEENVGTSIRVEASLVSVSGNLLFRNNTFHHEGTSGAVYLSSFAQMLLNDGVNISFLNNTGRQGAAIVVKYPRISSGFARTFYNPQCFLQFAEPQVPPIEWIDHNVSLEFRGNQAQIGPVLLITSLDTCSWFNNSDEYFNTNISETWTFMNASENYVIRNNQSLDNPQLYIQTEIQQLLIGEPFNGTTCQEGSGLDVCAYPGQLIKLNVTALDQHGNPTSGFLQLTPGEGKTEFSPSIVQTSVGREGVTFSYNSSDTYSNTTATVEASFSATEVKANFTLVHIGCPPGYRLDESQVCQCEERAEVLACDDINMDFVLLDEGLWGAPPQWSRVLVTYSCPAGYCNCTGSPRENSTEGCALIYSSPGLSCHPKRSGILCGQCRESYGVGMLTMECQEFTASFSMYYWLMPLLVIFIIVSVVVIVKAGAAIPSVLLGFLFYVQISPVAVAHISASFNLAPQVMGCFKSVLALYSPYDFSLHRGLTALEAYGLRFIPPVLVLILTPIIMKIKYQSKSWYGIWTLVLLMYAMTVETSASLLFCPTFTRELNGTSESVTVWFFDGSVTCYQGAHLALAIVAVVFLVLTGLLILATVAIVCQKEISRKVSYFDRHHFEKVSKAFTDPYKEVHKWWAPFELIRRYVIIITVIFVPGYLTVALSLVGAALAIQWFVQPYKHWWTNLAEALSLTVLVIVMCFGSNNVFVTLAIGAEYFVLWPLLYLPLGVAAGIFCVYFAWQLRRGVRHASQWWLQRQLRKNTELARPLHARTSTITAKIFKRVNTQVVTLDDSENCDL